MYLLLGQSGVAYAKELSNGLWKLSRPHCESETTQYYTGWVEHSNGDAAIYIPDESQPIHVDADVGAFMPLVTKELVPEEELQAFAATIESAKGGRLTFLTILQNSPSFSVDLRTRAELEADGWFPTEEI